MRSEATLWLRSYLIFFSFFTFLKTKIAENKIFYLNFFEKTYKNNAFP